MSTRGTSNNPVSLFGVSTYRVQIKMCPSSFSKKDYLRVIVVAEAFSEGVVVYFQLSDLCEEEEERNERMHSEEKERRPLMND